MSRVARIPLMILSFILSLMLWIYVQVVEDPSKPLQTYYDLKIEVKNLPAGLEITNDVDPIRVFPKGPEDERKRIDPKNLSAYVDLSKAIPGSAAYPVHVVVDADYAVQWQPKAPTVFLRIARTLTKTVPVAVQTVGQLENTTDFMYLPESTYTEPAGITIHGPEGDIERVTSARAVLDLRYVTRGRTYTSDVDLLEDGDRPASSSVKAESGTVVIHPGIGIPETKQIFISPVLQGSPAPGYIVKSTVVDPRQILLRGRSEALSALAATGVRTQPIDIQGIKESTVISASLDLPPDIAIAISRPVNVRVTLEPNPVKPSTRRTAG